MSDALGFEARGRAESGPLPACESGCDPLGHDIDGRGCRGQGIDGKGSRGHVSRGQGKWARAAECAGWQSAQEGCSACIMGAARASARVHRSCLRHTCPGQTHAGPHTTRVQCPVSDLASVRPYQCSRADGCAALESVAAKRPRGWHATSCGPRTAPCWSIPAHVFQGWLSVNLGAGSGRVRRLLLYDGSLTCIERERDHRLTEARAFARAFVCRVRLRGGG